MSEGARERIEQVQQQILHTNAQIEHVQQQIQAARTDRLERSKLMRQLNDLKRESRDLRIKMLELQNAAGGGAAAAPAGASPPVSGAHPSVGLPGAPATHAAPSPAPIHAAPSPRPVSGASRPISGAHSSASPARSAGGPAATRGPAAAAAGAQALDPGVARQLDELRRENRDLKVQLMQLREASGASAADAAVYDGVLAVLNQTIQQLERERDRAPRSNGGASGDNDDLLRQVRELERVNRDLERELSRAREGGGGGGAHELNMARRQIAQLEQALTEAQAEPVGDRSRADLARQLNDLKRENRDLRLSMQSGGGGGGGSGGDGIPPQLNDHVSQLRMDLRTMRDYLSELQRLVDVFQTIDRGALNRADRQRIGDAFDEIDPALVLEEFDTLLNKHQEGAERLKGQLRD